MNKFCPVCEESKNVNLQGKYKNKNTLFNDKKLYQCKECKLVFVYPMPSENELSNYYKTIWLNDEAICSTDKNVEITYKIQAEERLNYLLRHIQLNPAMKILDLGSGYGYLYDSFSKIGLPSENFYAVDSSPSNISRLRSKGIKTYEKLQDLNENNFDLICICFLLEHITDPCAFLRNIKKYVRRRGYIFIDLPERDDTFKNILEPHVCVYSLSSLSFLIKKLELKIIHATGYGVKRWLIRLKNSFFGKIVSRIGLLCMSIRRKIKLNSQVTDNDKQFTDSLYQYYRYNDEGNNRWWIRAILTNS